MEDKNKTLELSKQTDKAYLFELQKFFDIAENIKDEDLKQRVIFQMLKCDKVLTNLAESLLK